MKEHWNQRYSENTFAYGKEPNFFFANELAKLKPGKLLLPADGEGRNGVFAARLGWEVYAFDYSDEGKRKAEKLAEENGVRIDYRVMSIEDISYPMEHFDAAALVFAHFPPQFRKAWYNLVVQRLKRGGTMIVEGFSTDHMKNQQENPKAGGPPNKAMLYSEKQLLEDFDDLQINSLKANQRILKEGPFHQGKADLLQLLGTKK